MPRVASGSNDRKPHTDIAQPLHRECRQRRADPLALHQRVDRQHVDLPRPVVGMDTYGDVPDRTPVQLSHPHSSGVVLADGFHGLSLCRQPIRIHRPVDPLAQDRAERLEHRRPGAKRELHDGGDVGRCQGTDGRTHDRHHGDRVGGPHNPTTTAPTSTTKER
jgi:hypothetical protein